MCVGSLIVIENNYWHTGVELRESRLPINDEIAIFSNITGKIKKKKQKNKAKNFDTVNALHFVTRIKLENDDVSWITA